VTFEWHSSASSINKVVVLLSVSVTAQTANVSSVNIAQQNFSLLFTVPNNSQTKTSCEYDIIAEGNHSNATFGFGIWNISSGSIHQKYVYFASFLHQSVNSFGDDYFDVLNERNGVSVWHTWSSLLLLVDCELLQTPW